MAGNAGFFAGPGPFSDGFGGIGPIEHQGFTGDAAQDQLGAEWWIMGNQQGVHGRHGLMERRWFGEVRADEQEAFGAGEEQWPVFMR